MDDGRPAVVPTLSDRAPGTADVDEWAPSGWRLSYARAVSLSPEQQRSIDSLVAQVTVDNVLQVAARLRRQADAMELELYARTPSLKVTPCGLDPVSEDARVLFQKKIDEIVAVHWQHHDELRAAVDALRRSAIDYGFTDADLETTFRKLAVDR